MQICFGFVCVSLSSSLAGFRKTRSTDSNVTEKEANLKREKNVETVFFILFILVRKKSFFNLTGKEKK
jgi:hypothetical protein